ncbi:MAG: hypothetical protein ACP5PQ_02535 [Thermoproteota archaeon]
MLTRASRSLKSSITREGCAALTVAGIAVTIPMSTIYYSSHSTH